MLFTVIVGKHFESDLWLEGWGDSLLIEVGPVDRVEEGVGLHRPEKVKVEVKRKVKVKIKWQ